MFIKVPLSLSKIEYELLAIMLSNNVIVYRKKGRNDFIGRKIVVNNEINNNLDLDLTLFHHLISSNILIDTGEQVFVNPKAKNYLLDKGKGADKDIKAKYNLKIGHNKVTQTDILLGFTNQHKLKSLLKSDKYFTKEKLDNSLNIRNPNSGTIERLIQIKNQQLQLDTNLIITNDNLVIDLNYNGDGNSYVYKPKNESSLKIITSIKKG